MLFETLSDPYLDDRLPGDSQTPGLPVKRLDHPNREVDIYSSLLETGTASTGKVERRRHVLTAVKMLVEFFSQTIA